MINMARFVSCDIDYNFFCYAYDFLCYLMVLFYSVVVSGSGDSLLVHNMSGLKTKIIKGLLGSRQRIGFYSQSW